MRSTLLISSIILLFTNCNPEGENLVKIAGEAQGTTWHISYLSATNVIITEGVDSIFNRIDFSLSTYVPSSIISRINKNEHGVLVDDYFKKVLHKSMEVSENTNGLFDITVAPVVNAWGFGFTKKAAMDSVKMDSLLKLVGYKMIRLEGDKVVKQMPGMMLDFNAIAQGFTVDVLAAYLEENDIHDYLIEVGGEVKAKGKKKNNEPWTVGIDQPTEKPVDGRPLEAIVKLYDKALATSGNYRKFYIENGKKYAHIIDPHTGYPAKSNLLSATVIANDCMTADAYATTFMVMGLEKAKQFLADHAELDMEVFFICDENGKWKTYTSEKLKMWIEEIN